MNDNCAWSRDRCEALTPPPPAPKAGAPSMPVRFAVPEAALVAPAVGPGRARGRMKATQP